MSPADLGVSSIWSFGALGSGPDDLDIIRQSGVFDAGFYLGGCGDLAGEAAGDPLLHYHRLGWQQGRRPNLYFEPGWYLLENPDVQKLATDPLLHYLLYGEIEGRRPCPYFDPAWYRAAHDVPPGDICLRHFLDRRHSGEVSPLPEFDSGWYLRRYPDVAQAGMDPMEHYLIQGFREDRNPSAKFDSRFYKQRYLRDLPGENALLHYLRHRDRGDIRISRPDNETTIPREIRRNTSPGPCFEEVRALPENAPRRAMVLAYYLPQFHPIAENDAWWGRGFTEWTNLQRGVPRFAGHYQPRVSRDLGHYRLDDPATLRRQVALAQGAGLAGFVFYFYWFDGRRLLETPLDLLLADPSVNFPFCLMWANENWTRRWDGSEEQVLIRQSYRSEDEPALIATFARHFADPRYIRIEGRPVLMVYRAGLIPEGAAGVRRWRMRFRDLHGEDPIFVMAQVFGETDPAAFGMDGAIEFPPHKLVEGLKLRNQDLEILDDEFSAQVYDYDDVAAHALAPAKIPFPLIRTVIPGWDNDARRQGAGLVVHGATPAKYQAWLERSIRRATAEPFFGMPVVCVNAWNEWAEGAYLEPDLHHGAAFLNATGRAIAGIAASAGAGRLLLVGHDGFPAGAQLLLLHLGRMLVSRHGLRVEFLLLAGGAMLAAYEAIGPVTVAEDAEATDRFLADRHADGIRAALVNTAIAAPICTRLAEIGIAATLLIHELPRLLRERKMVESAGRGAAAAASVVFAAACIRDGFIAETGLSAARATVLRQGSYRTVAVTDSARGRIRAAFGIPDHAILAVGLGYGDLRKGFDLFLQVFRLVCRKASTKASPTGRRRGPPVHLMWVGAIDPVVASYLGAEMDAAVATGRCHFAGWREDVGDFLAAADTLLLTSREDPFPAAVLEALAAGLGVVAFEGSGGIPDLLRRHDAGLSVPMADAAAMATAMMRVAGASRAKTRAALAARQRRMAAIQTEHSFAAYAAGLLRLARPDLRDISVVVPAFNYARHMPMRLAAIFTQTYPVGEVIVLDDCSTDGSAEIARATAARWNREIAVIENAENSGSVFRQWARAAEAARGEFLWIAEADDGSEPEFLEHLCRAMEGVPDAVMAFSDSRCIDAQDRPIRASYQDYFAESAGIGALAQDDVFQAAGFARRFLAERNLVMNVSGVLWRRDAFAAALARCAADLSACRVAGDWRLYLELLADSAASVVYVARPLNVHRRHEDSVTHRLDWARHVDEIAQMQALAARRMDVDRDGRARQDRYLRDLRARSLEDPMHAAQQVSRRRPKWRGPGNFAPAADPRPPASDHAGVKVRGAGAKPGSDSGDSASSFIGSRIM